MKHSRSSLFLMELIMAILFFSLTSAVCIRLFVRAHTISQDTINQNNALTQAQNLAETWLATEGDMSELTALLAVSGGILPEVTPEGLTFSEGSSEDTLSKTASSADFRSQSTPSTGSICLRLYFDSDWKPCLLAPSDTPFYMAELTSPENSVSSSAHMISALIRICSSDGSELYRLELVHHIAEKKGDWNE